VSPEATKKEKKRNRLRNAIVVDSEIGMDLFDPDHRLIFLREDGGCIILYNNNITILMHKNKNKKHGNCKNAP
jgi:hypothetical protein